MLETGSLSRVLRNGRMKFTDVGRVETGMKADLVILKENPLEHLETVLDVEGVLKKGRFIKGIA